MSVATWVGLVRNSACALKPLLPADHVVHNVLIPSISVTYIEFIIGATQFLGGVLFLKSGLNDLATGISQHNKYSRFLLHLDLVSLDKYQQHSNAVTVLRHGFTEELKQSCRNVWKALVQILFFFCFVVLSVHTMHFRLPSHPAAVYYAVGLVLLGLVYFLRLMLTASLQNFCESLSWKTLNRKLLAHSTCLRASPTISLHELMVHGTELSFKHNLLAFLRTISPAVSLQSWDNHSAVQNVDRDIELLAELLKHESATSASASVAKAAAEAEELPKSPRRSSRRKSTTPVEEVPVVQETAAPSPLLQSLSQVATATYIQNVTKHAEDSRINGIFNLIYFFLNGVAFYSYFIMILPFFFPATAAALSGGANVCGSCVFRALLLFLTPSQAEWWGGFVGDAAWTIESVVCLTAPAIERYLRGCGSGCSSASAKKDDSLLADQMGLDDKKND